MPRVFKSEKDIEISLVKHVGTQDFEAEELAQVEEMMVMGYLCCPKEKTLLQRKIYFSEMKFSNLEQLLRYAETVDFV